MYNFRTKGSNILHGEQFPQGYAQIYYVENPRECKDFSWLVGKQVNIDSRRQKVCAVESYSRVIKYKGEIIGLVVLPKN